MLNSISLAARNVRFLLTCLWIYLPGATLVNLRYVCCLFLTKKLTFWAQCCGFNERFRLAWVNTEHRIIVPVVSPRLWGGELWLPSKLPTVAGKQLVSSITQGLTVDMNTQVEFVPTGCSTTLFVCLPRIRERKAAHMLKDDSQTESKAGRNLQVTVDLRRHLVREPPAARMKWNRIEQREGDKMAHLEDLGGLNQQLKATPLSGSALRLIHPYSNLHHVVDVCPSSTSSVNNNNDNRHFLLLWLRAVDGGPKQDSVVTWLEHYINPWIGLTVVKNLIPRASILYHTPVAAVSAGVYLYIRQ